MTIVIVTMTIATEDKIIIETIVTTIAVMVINMVVMIDMIVEMTTVEIEMIVVTIAPTIEMIDLTSAMIALTNAMIAITIETIAGVIMIAADVMDVVAIVAMAIVAERDLGSKSPKQNICQIITKLIARDKNLALTNFQKVIRVSKRYKLPSSPLTHFTRKFHIFLRSVRL